MIENEQREGLKPLELALFVQKRLALGDNQAEIAKRLGKSRQWVTLATALIEAPDWLLQAYREGRCRGMNELYEVRRLHGEHADVVEAWVAQQALISRDRVAALREELASTLRPQTTNPAETEPSAREAPTTNALHDEPVTRAPGSTAALEATTPPAPTVNRSSRTDQRIHVEFDGQDYQLVVSVAPDQAGHLYVRPLTGGPRRLAPASAVKLLGFVGA